MEKDENEVSYTKKYIYYSAAILGCMNLIDIRLAKEIGREPATVDEAKEMLEL